MNGSRTKQLWIPSFIAAKDMMDLPSSTKFRHVHHYVQTGYFRHLLRDVSGDAAHIGLETMLATIPHGARFIETEHTAQHFREECWFSALVDHRSPLAWANNPSDLIVRARERARDWFGASDNQCPLSASQRRDILAVVTNADRLVAATTEKEQRRSAEHSVKIKSHP